MSDIVFGGRSDIWSTNLGCASVGTPDIRPPPQTISYTKNRLFKRACSTKSPDHWETYRKARNKANASVKRAKAAYLNDQARQLADPNCPPRKWWCLAKTLCGLGKEVSSNISPLLTETNDIIWDDHGKADLLNDTFVNDLICTTPRLCQNNMTPVAVRGRGTTSTYNCFPATGLYFKSKVLASVGRDSTETTRLQHGSSMFGDTHAKGGGGGV